MLLFLCWVLQLYAVNARFLYLYVNTCVLHVCISNAPGFISGTPPPIMTEVALYPFHELKKSTKNYVTKIKNGF